MLQQLSCVHAFLGVTARSTPVDFRCPWTRLTWQSKLAKGVLGLCTRALGEVPQWLSSMRCAMSRTLIALKLPSEKLSSARRCRIRMWYAKCGRCQQDNVPTECGVETLAHFGFTGRNLCTCLLLLTSHVQRSIHCISLGSFMCTSSAASRLLLAGTNNKVVQIRFHDTVKIQPLNISVAGQHSWQRRF